MNRCCMNLLLVMAGIALLPISITAQQPNALTSLQKSFQQQEKTVLDGYGQSLDAIMAERQKNGDLDSCIVIRAEKKRFEAEKTVPSLSDVNATFKAAAANYYKARAGILKQYIGSLDALVKAEVQADRIESAKAVKEEKEKIDFILADLGVQFKTVAKKGKLSPTAAVAFGGHHYLLVPDNVSWQEAKTACEQMDGHLVIVNNAKEDSFVATLAAGRNVWLGCTDEAEQGVWLWGDGAKLTYAGWAPSEPNNYGGREHWGVCCGDGRWNDVSIDTLCAYVCEWDR
ncbi:MAG: C-type lectin domain-containing protein [bacterium]